MKQVPGERMYRLLLRLHPAAFRRRHGRELVNCFRDAWREEVVGKGVWVAVRFWWHLVRGTAATACRQWMRPGRFPDLRRRRGMSGAMAWLDGMVQDARYAVRMLQRSPGFAAAVLVTLGLGVGAATAVFTVVDGVLLRPLPYPEPDHLYTVSQDGADGSYWLSAPNYQDLKRELAGVESMGAYSPEGANVVVEGDPARLSVAEVDADFFRTLSLAPALGRTFTEEERAAGAAVAVVSHGVWQGRLGGREDALGRTITLDGREHTVVGVMPPGPTVPADVNVWTPLILERPEWRTRRGISWIRVLARLEPDAELADVQARAAGLSASLREEYPAENRRFEVGLRSLEKATVGPVQTELRTLMAAVALMLVVAAINVGGLLLARATVRHDELAVRVALGGGPRRLMAQLLTENVVLAALGILLGVVFGRLGVALLIASAPPGTPRLDEVALGPRGLVFAVAAGMAVALLLGAVSVVSAFRGSAETLRSSRSGGGAGTARLRDALVVSQVALALALLFGAGLLARSFWNVQQVDPGFRPDGVLVAGLPVGSAFRTEEARETHYRALLERASAMPGVRNAALTSSAPFTGYGVVFSYELPDVPEATGVEKLSRFRIATPGVFETLGIPILRGGTFSPVGAAGAGTAGAVVSEELARRWFGGREPIGARIVTAGDTFRITGVAGAIRDVSRRSESPLPHVYVSVMPSTRQSMTLVLRTERDPSALIEPLLRAVREAAPVQPVTPLRPMTALMGDAAARDRFTLVLLSFFAAAALLLAAVGLYGVLAYTVSRRTREIGVRLALGAPAARVRGMVVNRGLALAGIGLGLGLVLAWWGGRFLEGLLFEVQARDPLLLIAVPLTLICVALLAAWIPARRATRVAPVEALRAE